MNFYELTYEEQVKCINVMRAKDLEKVLDSTYNPFQIRLNRKAINAYYDNLIKELSMEKDITDDEQKLSKVA